MHSNTNDVHVWWTRALYDDLFKHHMINFIKYQVSLSAFSAFASDLINNPKYALLKLKYHGNSTYKDISIKMRISETDARNKVLIEKRQFASELKDIYIVDTDNRDNAATYNIQISNGLSFDVTTFESNDIESIVDSFISTTLSRLGYYKAVTTRIALK